MVQVQIQNVETGSFILKLYYYSNSNTITVTVDCPSITGTPHNSSRILSRKSKIRKYLSKYTVDVRMS